MHRHLQRVGYELGAHGLGHRPPDDPSGVGVLHGCEVEPPLPGPQIGDVRDPQLIRSVRPELPFNQIVGDPHTGHPDRGAPALDLHQARDPGLTHQPAHTPTRDADALTEAQLGLHTARAIDAACALVDLGDPRGQPRIAQGPVARCPALPAVKAGAADAKHLTHHRDWETGPLRRDDPVCAHRVSVSAAKRTAARLRMSRSCSTRLTRLRSSRSSSRSAGQPIVAFSPVELVLLDPVMQRLIAATQALRYVSDAPAGEDQLDGLAAKLRRIRRAGSWHDGHPFASTPLKPFGVRRSASTPQRP
jgi:hypothetical protein